MEFQVITDKRLPKIRAGRSTMAFYYRKDIGAVSEGVEDHKTDTGRMKVSSVELTLLDLLRYPHAAGGLDNIATIVSGCGPPWFGGVQAVMWPTPAIRAVTIDICAEATIG